MVFMLLNTISEADAGIALLIVLQAQYCRADENAVKVMFYYI